MAHQDTNRRRAADSVRLLRRLRRLEQHGPLYMHTVPLWLGSVYDDDDIRAGKLAAATILEGAGSPPAWANMEAGRCGGLHLHIITPARWLGLLPGAVRRDVYDLPGLAHYQSKPKDARRAMRRPWELSRFSAEELRAQYLASLEEEAAARLARGGRRCPARSWWFTAGATWRPPSASAWRLLPLAALSLALLGLAACAASVRPVAAPAPRPGLATPLGGRRPAVRPVRRWRASGRWAACVAVRGRFLPG